jgi:acetyl-CoA synthetase
MRRPSIGLSRGLWRSPDRYIESYWRAIPGVWVQGDLASRDEDGLWYLHGRSDDTIKIGGKRIGPQEIEAALIETALVADAAVVGVPDPITGSALACVCVPRDPVDDAGRLKRALVAYLRTRFGAPYRPKHVVLVSALPRTGNQKLMRRLVRSALANPESVEELRAASAQAGLGSTPCGAHSDHGATPDKPTAEQA